MNRNEREAATLAEIDRIAVNIRQARTINRIVIAILIVAAFLVGTLWHPAWAPRPAHAAKRPVYTGTVTICYAPSSKAPKLDQYLYSQWDIVKAAKVAGVGKVKVVKERYPHVWKGIKAAIAAGQWIVVGSQWVEPDGNLPSGEAMVMSAPASLNT